MGRGSVSGVGDETPGFLTLPLPPVPHTLAHSHTPTHSTYTQVAEAQHAMGISAREVKRLKGVVERTEGELTRERKEAESRSQPLIKEVASSREAAKRAETALREANGARGGLTVSVIVKRCWLSPPRLDPPRST